MAFRTSPFGAKFGFERKNDVEKKQREKLLSRKTVIEIDKDDGAIIVDAAGFDTTAIALNPVSRTIIEDINEYRRIASTPEVDTAIDDIINDAVTTDTEDDVVEINLDHIDMPDEIKEKILEEFNTVCDILRFDITAYDIFRQWYVDGRLFAHKVVDDKKKSDGIRQVVFLDPRGISKVKELKKDINDTGVETIVAVKTYYHYDPSTIPTSETTQAQRYVRQVLELSEESVCYIHSGLIHPTRHSIQSHLEKARKPVNNLAMMEDALVIYRISRAPERRIFYIDVGSLPAKSAEAHVQSIMNRYKNRISYDVSTGKVKNNAHEMTLLEDFWLPRREGGRGTEISNLQGGDRLGITDDVEYFLKKVYKALNVPYSRVDSENTISLGARAAEITRDELKFAKFISRLRRRFADLFTDLLGTNLILKGIMTETEWIGIKNDIQYDFVADNIIQEQREAELLESRMSLLRDAKEYEGTYFTREQIMKQILRMSDEDIKEQRVKMQEEIKAGLYKDPMAEDDEGGGRF